MTAWIVFTVMAAVAAVGVTLPLVRRYDTRRAAPAESAVLGRQLADLASREGVEGLTTDDAEGLRAETVRRFLAEAPAVASQAKPVGPRALLALGLGVAAIVALGATLLYTRIGRPDLAGGAQVAAGDGQGASQEAGAPGGRVGSMIAELEARMRQTPADPEGWRMLGWSYMQTGRFAESACAYGRAAALDPANADDKSARGEALVKAADGHVTPEARAAFAAAVELDPADPRARYFLAAAKDQAGDRAGAMNDWIALLKSAPPGAQWAREVRGFVLRIAAARGEDVAGRLPPDPGPAPPSSPPDAQAGGPTADQAAAAQRMAPADQQAMIHGMVDRLAARLKANPSDADGWVSLMRARMVLGDPVAATQAYRDGLKAFAGAPSQQSGLTQGARQLGVPGA